MHRKGLVKDLLKCFLGASIVFSVLAVAASITCSSKVSTQALVILIVTFIIAMVVLIIHNVLRFIDWIDEGCP